MTNSSKKTFRSLDLDDLSEFAPRAQARVEAPVKAAKAEPKPAPVRKPAPVAAPVYQQPVYQEPAYPEPVYQDEAAIRPAALARRPLPPPQTVFPSREPSVPKYQQLNMHIRTDVAERFKALGIRDRYTTWKYGQIIEFLLDHYDATR